MQDTSRSTRQKTWHGQPRRVSVLAEMALRQEKVSQRLRELRELQGLSQEDAARKVGITNRQWQRWESGQSMPYPRSLDMVASAFGISVAEFFDPVEPVIVDESQLDRIETMLDAITAYLGIDTEEAIIAGAERDLSAPRDGRGAGDSAKRSGAKRGASRVPRAKKRPA